jgi:hypothetical protein
VTAVADVPLLDGQPVRAGIYDIPEDTYFGASWALSCSGCKLLLPPSCPAKFFYRQDHQIHSTAFDIGHAAHKLVLGTGAEITEVKAKDWRTKAAQEAQEKAYADGKIPLLTKELEQVKAMAAAIESNPVAYALLDPYNGRAEQSLFWQDPRTGLWCRARVDWMYDQGDGRLIIVDYKTTSGSAHPEEIGAACGSFRYDMQDAWYSDGAAIVFGKPVDFVFIFQEKTAPYLVTVVQLSADDRRGGRMLNNRAIDEYLACVKAGEWPGYSDQIEIAAIPPWKRPKDDYS